MNRHVPGRWFLIVVLGGFFPGPAGAAAPSEINYQGKLADAAGSPSTATSVNLRFDLLDNFGTVLQSIPINNVPVSFGVFNARVPVDPAVVQSRSDLWLRISVNGTPLTPAHKLLASPYALSIANNSVTDASVSPGAAIATSKISGAVSSISGHGLGALAFQGSVTDAQVPNDVTVNFAGGAPWSGITGVPADIADGDQGVTSVGWNNITGGEAPAVWVYNRTNTDSSVYFGVPNEDVSFTGPRIFLNSVLGFYWDLGGFGRLQLRNRFHTTGFDFRISDDPVNDPFNTVAAKPGGGAWAALSDARLKRDVRPLPDSLGRLLSLRGVSFEYIDPARGKGRFMGFIAQEVEKVFPPWVTTGEDGYKLINIHGFEALTVEALRQLKDENDALKKRSENLERRLEALEKRAEALGRP